MSTVNLDEFHLDFDCVECPPCLGHFAMRVTHSELDELAKTRQIPYKCPRGHEQTWTSFRGSCNVDSAGYTIDRNHPLWRY